jgi:hypothetical protein
VAGVCLLNFEITAQFTDGISSRAVVMKGIPDSLFLWFSLRMMDDDEAVRDMELRRV